jgi:BatD DUF11 like domain
MDIVRITISMLAGVLLGLNVSAQQAEVTASTKRILLGEQFDLTIKVDAAANSLISFPIIPDSLNHLEVVKRSNVDSVRSGDRMSYTSVLTLTGFEPGQWTIPSFVFRVNGKNIKSDSLRINIMPVPLKGKDYNDIKEIRDVEDSGINWQRILIALGGALVIGVLVYYWWKQRQPKPAILSTVSRSTAYEEALSALKKLKQEGADQRGEMKLYYSGLYDIFRSYLTHVSGRSAMHFTTDELMLSTRDMLPTDQFTAVAEVFRISDAVKFARYASDTGESAASWERIRQGIDEINRMKK